jgi:hypothetical protein
MSQSSQVRDTASEKEAWTTPVLRELDVRETANFTSVPGSNDGQVDCS